MVTTPEGDLQKDLEALRADIVALKAEAAIAKNVRKASDGAGAGGDMRDESLDLGQDGAKATVVGARAGTSRFVSGPFSKNRFIGGMIGGVAGSAFGPLGRIAGVVAGRHIGGKYDPPEAPKPASPPKAPYVSPLHRPPNPKRPFFSTARPGKTSREE